jgi:Family of unknown function (DUF6130)
MGSLRSTARRLGSFAVAAALALAGAAWATPVADAEPQLAVLGPAPGATVAGTSVTVSFRVTDLRLVPTTVPVSEAGMRPEANRPGEGHVHFLLDAQPLVVWERLDPYVFTNIPPGEHVLLVELVQNDHGPLSTPVAQTIRFRTTGLLASSGAGAGRGAPLQAGGLALAAGIALAGAGFLGARQASARRRRW